LIRNSTARKLVTATSAPECSKPLRAAKQLGVQFTTLEDFERMEDTKRVVVIGCTGSGKSTLLNKLAGVVAFAFLWSLSPPLARVTVTDQAINSLWTRITLESGKRSRLCLSPATEWTP
jgi:ribosome biogenesis GTPase A